MQPGARAGSQHLNRPVRAPGPVSLPAPTITERGRRAIPPPKCPGTAQDLQSMTTWPSPRQQSQPTRPRPLLPRQTSHLHEEPWVRSFCPASSCAPCLPISCSAPSLVCSHVCSPGPSRRTPLNFPWVLQSEAESLEGSKRPGSTPPAKPASWAPSMAEKLPQLQGPQPS